MAILIEKSEGGKKGTCYVFENGNKIGYVREFCCGVDFCPEYNKFGYFSIIDIHKMYDPKLKTVISTIKKLKLPKKDFHWNFSYKTAKDKSKLKEYQEKISKI